MENYVLIIGKGAREHAFVWKLSQSSKVSRIFVLPGNGGTVVVGPDNAVVDGIELYFRDSGIPCFSPSKDAAEIEGSKTFAKEFMQRHRHNIPTARFRNFHDHLAAKEYLESVSHRIVLKVSGLAAGKGVVLLASKEGRTQLSRGHHGQANRTFGDAGSSAVIEEFLGGDEISIHAFSDGKAFRSLPPGQDHKRIFEGDLGPNTRGNGRAGSSEMITNTGPEVIEYNTRSGDPETRSMVPLPSQETDMFGISRACL
ncbi:phosphoribosylamine--glycine ligase [Biscogniauxia marginata]|nr:phosphoribosylamine--glycine ligase [Biscogniauxia marginata]